MTPTNLETLQEVIDFLEGGEFDYEAAGELCERVIDLRDQEEDLMLVNYKLDRDFNRMGPPHE